MRIMVINPNSSQEMTEHIRSELEQVKRDDTEITVVANAGAPAAIESASDIAEAVPLLLKLVRQANEQRYDGIIIACFSDPGLEAAREQSAVLVMGIQETALHVATMLGHKYTILTPLTRRIPSKEQDVRRFKVESSLASVRALGMTVTDTEANPGLTNTRILDVARKAAEEDGAEVILLGCAGMTGYAKDVEKELGVVVLDPTSVTLKVCEALIDAGVRHSKRALYATP